MRRLRPEVLIVASVSATLLGSSVSGQSPKTPRQAELAASVDTWVDQAAPEAGNGTAPDLVAQFNLNAGSRILIGFDLRPIRGAHINSATLRLSLTKASGPDAVQMAVSALTGKWDEQTTWHSQPDRSATYRVVEVGSSPGAVTWDLTQLFQETIEAHGSLPGIALSGPLVGPHDLYSRTFASREAGEAAPRLAVEYVPGAAQRRTQEARTSPAEAEPEAAGAGSVRLGIAAVLLAAIVVVVLAVLRRRRKLT